MYVGTDKKIHVVKGGADSVLPFSSVSEIAGVAAVQNWGTFPKSSDSATLSKGTYRYALVAGSSSNDYNYNAGIAALYINGAHYASIRGTDFTCAYGTFKLDKDSVVSVSVGGVAYPCNAPALACAFRISTD